MYSFLFKLHHLTIIQEVLKKHQPNRHILNLECQGYSDFLRSFNSFHRSLKLNSDEAIYVAVKCNCNVINYIWQSNCM